MLRWQSITKAFILPMSPKRPKRVKVREEPKTEKVARIPAIPDTGKLNPSWQISILEMYDSFGWHEIDRDTLNEIRKKISNFESMTWNEILVRDSHRNHFVAIPRICREAQDRLQELRLDDIDGVTSLRLSGLERVWGIRDGAVLKLLWWDPDHSICPSLPRYT